MRNETVLWFEENGLKLPVGILGIGSILLFVCFNPKNLRSRGVELAKEDTSRVCVSAFFYLFDIISDIALGISFIIRGEIYWGVATFLLVLISGWLVAGYSYFHSSKKIYGENENEDNGSGDNGSLAIGHVFLVGPFMHYLHYYKRMKAWTTVNSGENRNLRAPKLEEEKDLNDMRDELLKIRALEAATEAAPQLLIQIFFIQKCLHSDSDESCVSVLQILSLISSLLTFTYMTTRRKNLQYKSILDTQRLFYVNFQLPSDRFRELGDLYGDEKEHADLGRNPAQCLYYCATIDHLQFLLDDHDCAERKSRRESQKFQETPHVQRIFAGAFGID
ncbi:Oidioi.mRNA.OKI2018_I69.PAR.g9271.t1.cds [Oikopleura dioica]|uniref:XK-related protein n=1 Tax=Oikopleura dioica TaxID=34765 RepID=A0ABN7RPA7_OIKDI|nr:Oidioi.mRNA.OKI2018_I69.PAR.g9271.t1.cds [Oikopleura dioica]